MKPENVSVFTRSSSSGVGPLGQELGHLFVHRLLDLGGVAVFLDVGLDREEARDLARVDVGRDPRCDLLVVDEALVEARGLTGREQVAEQVEQDAVPRRVARDVPRLDDAGLRDAILGGLPRASGALFDPLIEAGDRRAGRDVAEVSLDLRQDLLGVDVAGDDDHGVVRVRSRS